MRVGVMMNLQAPNLEPPDNIISRGIEVAQAADELGFHSVWLTEHHFSSYGYSPTPLMLLVKIAGLTRNIRLGTAVLVVPFHHPLQLAEEIALADMLTDGRLEVGFGRGYQPYEFVRFGQNMEESRGRYEEGLDIITQALESGFVTYNGTYYQIPETYIMPKCVQKPHPPYWVAAQSEESTRMAVQRGMNILTAATGPRAQEAVKFWNLTQELLQQGNLDYRPIFALQQYVYVGETDEEARTKMELIRWHPRVAVHLRRGTERVEAGGLAVAQPIEGEMDDETFFREGAFLGSPETVVERVRTWREQWPFVEHLNCSFWPRDLSHEEVLKSMERFAKHALPILKEL